MRRRENAIEEWRTAVYAADHISDSCRVLLLLLSDYMRDDLTVTVKREVIAKRLGRSDRRIAARFREAVGEDPTDTDEERLANLERRLLDRIVRGQRNAQAVYKGLLPNSLNVTPAVTLKAFQHDGNPHVEQVGKCHEETPQPRSLHDTRGSRLTTAEPPAGVTERDVSQDENSVGITEGSRPTACEEHGWCEDHRCLTAGRRTA